MKNDKRNSYNGTGKRGSNNKRDSKSCKQGGGKSLPSQDGKKQGSKALEIPTNDAFWYALSEAILKDSASYPFSSPVGAKIFGTGAGVSGIMRIIFHPSIGYAKDASSPVNLAAQKFFSFIRQANSGSKNYEAPDLMMYFLGVGSVYEILASGKRAFGLCKKFSNYNRYLAKNLVQAAGFDYDDLVSKQANFRARWNTVVKQINESFHIPAGFNLFERTIFRNSHVFVDHPGNKFQMYIYSQKSYLKFSGTAVETGSSLIGSFIPEECTVDQYFSFLQEYINELVMDEDIQIMSGDVLKAYGDSGCFKVSELDENFETQIAYDVPVLGQIHNIQTNYTENLIPAWKNFDGVNAVMPFIYQKNGIIISEQTGNQNISVSAGYTDTLLLDIPVESPSPADVMECTRMMTFYDQNELALYSGSEVILGLEIWTQSSGDPSQITKDKVTASLFSNSEANTDRFLARKSSFDWSPIIIHGDIMTDLNMTTDYAFGDISNFTLLQKANIVNLHEAALLGLFDIPTLSVSR